MPNTYGYTDFSDYDTGRGGPTPEWSYGVDGDRLEVTVNDDANDPPAVPKTVKKVLAPLEARLVQLRKEAQELADFLEAARQTTKVVTEESDEDDDE